MDNIEKLNEYLLYIVQLIAYLNHVVLESFWNLYNFLFMFLQYFFCFVFTTKYH